MDSTVLAIIISSAVTIIGGGFALWQALSKNRGDFQLQTEQLIISTRKALDDHSDTVFERMKQINDRLSRENEQQAKQLREQSAQILLQNEKILQLELKLIKHNIV